MNGPLHVLKRNQEAARTKVRKFYIESAWNFNMNLHLILNSHQACRGTNNSTYECRTKEDLCLLHLPRYLRPFKICPSAESTHPSLSLQYHIIYLPMGERKVKRGSVCYHRTYLRPHKLVLSLQCYNPRMNHICHKPDESES